MLEDLRQKLLSRLDALNKKRGQFQNLNSFIEFRNAAGVQKGKSVDFNGFKKALNQFDCPGRHNDSIVQKAFGILTRKDQNVSTNDLSITFNHVSERLATLILILLFIPSYSHNTLSPFTCHLLSSNRGVQFEMPTKNGRRPEKRLPSQE